MPKPSCRKRKHKTEGAAVLFQQLHYPGKAFDVYQCPECPGSWHVSLHGLSPQAIEEIISVASNPEDKRRKLVGKPSNLRRIYKIKHPLGTFKVLYRRKQKDYRILS